MAGAVDAPAHRAAQRAVPVPLLGDLVGAPDLLRDLACLLLRLVPVKRNQKLPVPVPRPAGGAGPPTILHSSRAWPLRRGQSGPKLGLGTKLPPCASKRSPSAILSCIARPARSTLRISAPSASLSPESAAPVPRRYDPGYRRAVDKDLGDWLDRSLDDIDRRDVEQRFRQITEHAG